MAQRVETADSRGNNLATYAMESIRDKTVDQLNCLVGCINTLKDITISIERTEPLESSKKIISPEVLAAANATTISCLSQIDNIIDDMRRWDVSPEPLEVAHKRMLEANTALIVASRKEIQSRSRPSVRNTPEMVRLDDGSWAALAPNSAEVLGVGKTPAEALENYDTNFGEA